MSEPINIPLPNQFALEFNDLIFRYKDLISKEEMAIALLHVMSLTGLESLMRVVLSNAQMDENYIRLKQEYLKKLDNVGGQ